MNNTLTFETYAAAKLAGGDDSKIITTGPTWSGSNETKNKFNIYVKNMYLMCDSGWVFAKPKDHCISLYDFSKLGYSLCIGDMLEGGDGSIITFENTTQILFWEFSSIEIIDTHIFVLSAKDENGLDLVYKNQSEDDQKIAEYKKQIEILTDINKSNLKTIEQYTKLIQSMSK